MFLSEFPENNQNITDQSGHFTDPILHCGRWDFGGAELTALTLA